MRKIMEVLGFREPKAAFSLHLYDVGLTYHFGAVLWHEAPQQLKFPDNHRFGYRVFNKVGEIASLELPLPLAVYREENRFRY